LFAGIFSIGVIAITRWLTLDLTPCIPLITNLTHRSNIWLLKILIRVNLWSLIILVWGKLRLPLGSLETIRQLGSKLGLGAKMHLNSKLGLGPNLSLKTRLGLRPRLGLKTEWGLRSNEHSSTGLSRPRWMSLGDLRLNHLARRWSWIRLRLTHLPRGLSLLGIRLT